MARCLEIILLIFLVRAADLEAKIAQGDQVSQFVNKTFEQKNIFSLKRCMFKFFEKKMKFC